MALLWIEGFEGFGTTTGAAPAPTDIIAQKYLNIVDESAMRINAGRHAGRCLSILVQGDWLTSPDLTTNGTIVIGFAVKWSAWPNTTKGEILRFMDGTSIAITVKLQVGTGKLLLYRGSTLLETSTNVVDLDTWYFFELKMVVSNTGSYECRMDGVVWLEDTGPVDTQEGSNAYYTGFRLEGSDGTTVSFDDLYFLDGATGLSGFQGEHRVVALNPNGDDTITWDRSTGSFNYAVIDDGFEVDQADYVSTDTTPEQDLYDYEDLGVSITAVRGVQVMTEADIDTGTMDLASVVKSGTTESVGTPDSLTPGDVTLVRLIEDDPDAAAPWTPTTLDAALFGIKATT